MTNASGNRPENRPEERPPAGGGDPLWLPRGSVRSLIALGLVAVWATLETGVLGGQPGGAPDVVRLLAVSVAAGYGLLRRWEVANPPDIRNIITGNDSSDGRGNRGEGED